MRGGGGGPKFRGSKNYDVCARCCMWKEFLKFSMISKFRDSLLNRSPLQFTVYSANEILNVLCSAIAAVQLWDFQNNASWRLCVVILDTTE